MSASIQSSTSSPLSSSSPSVSERLLSESSSPLSSQSSSLGISPLSTLSSAISTAPTRKIDVLPPSLFVSDPFNQDLPTHPKLLYISNKLDILMHELKAKNCPEKPFNEISIEDHLFLFNLSKTITLFTQESLLELDEFQGKDPKISAQVTALIKQLSEQNASATKTKQLYTKFSFLQKSQEQYEELMNSKRMLGIVLSRIQGEKTECLLWNAKDADIQKASELADQILLQTEKLLNDIKPHLDEELDPKLVLFLKNENDRLNQQLETHLKLYNRLLFFQNYLADLKNLLPLRAACQKMKNEITLPLQSVASMPLKVKEFHDLLTQFVEETHLILEIQQKHKQDKNTPSEVAEQIDKECAALNKLAETLGEIDQANLRTQAAQIPQDLENEIIDFLYNSQSITLFRVGTKNQQKAQEFASRILKKVQDFALAKQIEPLVVMSFIKFAAKRIIEEDVDLIKSISGRPILADQVKIVQKRIQLYLQGDMIKKLLLQDVANKWIAELRTEVEGFLTPLALAPVLPSSQLESLLAAVDKS